MQRKCKDESELKAMAQDYAQTITIRTYDAHDNSTDTARKTRAQERKTLEAILYGALLAANYYRDTDNDQKITATAEFTARQLIKDINTYDSIFLPLLKIFRYWEMSND